MEEDKRVYLTFLQNVITRMNSNSFDIKKWNLAIITACIGTYTTAEESNPYMLIIGIVISFGFWIMDAYYLRMERQYRSLFSDAIKNKNIMFNMDASIYIEDDCQWWAAIKANTVWPIYLLPIIVMTVAFIFNYWINIEIIHK